jgi:hypothetical protein
MPSTTTRGHRHKTLWTVVCVTAAAWSGVAQAACLDDAAVAQWVQRYEARLPAANPPPI